MIAASKSRAARVTVDPYLVGLTRVADQLDAETVLVRPGTVSREGDLDGLVDRLFGGDALPLLRHLIEDRGKVEEEIAELRRLLDKLEREAADDPDR